MTRLDLPPDLTQTIRDLEARIARLERAPKANTPGTSSPWPVASVNDIATAVTGSSFSVTYEARWGGALTHPVLAISGNVAADVGTEGEYRIRIYTQSADTSDLTTAPFPIADGANFQYGHQVAMGDYWELGTNSVGLVQVEARRTSGAGNVWTFAPLYVFTASPELFNVVTPIDDLL